MHSIHEVNVVLAECHGAYLMTGQHRNIWDIYSASLCMYVNLIIVHSDDEKPSLQGSHLKKGVITKCFNSNLELFGTIQVVPMSLVMWLWHSHNKVLDLRLHAKFIPSYLRYFINNGFKVLVLVIAGRNIGRRECKRSGCQALVGRHDKRGNVHALQRLPK